jgi:hypothetical protein
MINYYITSRVILPYFNRLISKNTVKLDQNRFGELSVKRVHGLNFKLGLSFVYQKN